MSLSYAQKLSQLDLLSEELHTVIEQRATEVAALRNTPLAFNADSKQYRREFTYDEYECEKMREYSGNVSYGGVDYPIDYPLDTPLIAAKFGAWIGDGYERLTVTFPESYLDDPSWRINEQALVNRVEAVKSDKAQAAANVERERKLAELARLKKELGV